MQICTFYFIHQGWLECVHHGWDQINATLKILMTSFLLCWSCWWSQVDQSKGRVFRLVHFPVIMLSVNRESRSQSQLRIHRREPITADLKSSQTGLASESRIKQKSLTCCCDDNSFLSCSFKDSLVAFVWF